MVADKLIWLFSIRVTMSIEPYGVLLAQTDMLHIFDVNTIREVRERNLAKTFGMLRRDASASLLPFVGAAYKVRLVVLPEFYFGNLIFNPAQRDTVENFKKISVEIPGEWTDKLAAKAVEWDTYLATAVEEYDPEWPDKVWDTAFIIDPQGKVILKYRKINCLNSIGVLPHSTVGTVFTEYVKKYGYDQVFPVVDTSIGKLGCLICYDVNFPEVARSLALKGAEVLIHPTSDTFPYVKNARAYENTAYFVSANIPPAGLSMIVDYRGNFVTGPYACPAHPGNSIVRGDVDIEALRKFRATRHPQNFLTQHKTGVYAGIYENVEVIPKDYFSDNLLKENADGVDCFNVAQENLYKQGIFKKPSQ